MLLETVVKELKLSARNESHGGTEVAFGYASDLLSDVLAKAKKDTLLITNQKHQNIIGVAVMLGLSGVVIAGGIDPDENTLEKAKAENVGLYTTELSLFETAGRMYELGIRSA